MTRAQCVALILLLAGLSACAGNPYPGYSDSLYTALYENTPEALGEHELLLEEVIAWYDQEGQILPPGVAAELAFYQAKLGRTDQVDELLRREMRAYPESKLFIEALRRFLLGAEDAPIFEREPEEEDEGDAEDR
jgi:hypothetical protein